MRESKLDRYLVARVKALKGKIRKVVFTGHRGAPDRMVWLPGLPFIVMMEIKATGKKSTAGQLREQMELRRMGFVVFEVSSKEQIDGAIDALLPWQIK